MARAIARSQLFRREVAALWWVWGDGARRPKPQCAASLTVSENTAFLILDGHNLAYRSFFAVRGLTTRDGRPSNALFGFVKTWHALRNALQPTHACAVFDGGLPAERTALLPEYKAQRPPMPEELRAQLDAIEQFLNVARVPVFREAGREADDVIATLATAAARDGVPVRIASNDKDLCAIVSHRIHLLTPGVESGGELGPAEVAARFGVPPERVLEWLSLTGDVSDNVPGVPGVGPKTAAKLLTEFGSLENLWARLAEVKPDRLRERLAAHREQVLRNRELMRLRTDLPLPRGWRDCAVSEPDSMALRDFYARWNFDSLIREPASPRLL